MNEPGALVPPPRHADSRVRDHLANERTFLAWVRTALGLIGVGFVLARMSLFLRQIATNPAAKAAVEVGAGREFLITGVGFLVFGFAVCLGSGWAYHRSRRAIDLGQYEPPRSLITAVTLVVALGGLAIIGLVLGQLVRSGQV